MVSLSSNEDEQGGPWWRTLPAELASIFSFLSPEAVMPLGQSDTNQVSRVSGEDCQSANEMLWTAQFARETLPR